ncbi:MAG: dicarboxylate/amino acid:cation symporter [Alphaproteobacteria bacterium]|nr:dicarboxylate/amino acid:cation symporter [Alphaproteobacteria bacterium]
MKSLFARLVVASMVSGIATGWACNAWLAPADAAHAAALFALLMDAFLRLIRMIIAPLVFSTLLVGIAHMEDATAVGRIGLKTLAWFLAASLVSLLLGLVMVTWLKPGVGMALSGAGAAPTGAGFSLERLIGEIIPTSIADAMARNAVLQIVVFTVFVGIAISKLEARAPLVTGLVEELAAIMLKVTGFVMNFAPLAIFGALASTVAVQGLPVLLVYARFMGGFYATMLLFWLLLALVLMALLRRQAKPVLAAVRDPALLAFSVASSDAAYPRLMAALPGAGIPRRIVSFVLPLGYAFNLDGSMMYCTFAGLFLLQAHGVTLSFAQQTGMLGMLLITSKGIAGVPRASLVVIMATLASLGYPESWIGLVLAVDHLLDMGRSATNVLGNAVAAAVVGKWEGALDREKQLAP